MRRFRKGPVGKGAFWIDSNCRRQEATPIGFCCHHQSFGARLPLYRMAGEVAQRDRNRARNHEVFLSQCYKICRMHIGQCGWLGSTIQPTLLRASSWTFSAGFANFSRGPGGKNESDTTSLG